MKLVSEFLKGPLKKWIVERVKTFRLSSNSTLVLKIFFPTFWIVFFGLFVFATFTISEDVSPFLNRSIVKWSILGFFLCFLAIFYFTIMSLKRVDADKTYIYISNYFKSYRYKLSDIAHTKETNFGLFVIVYIHLKSKGSLGKRPFFVLNKATFQHYLKTHPENYEYFTLKSMK